MRVLVTGHAGYIGAVAVEALIEAGHEVVGLDTGFFEGCGFRPPTAIPQIRKDVRDIQASDVAGFDGIVHLAALCNDPLGDLDPELTLDINYRASVRLATFARDGGCRRFVFASSCSMYGAATPDDLLTEDAPLRPLTAYAESKVRTEEDLVPLADSHFSPVYLRNATAYGYSPRLRGDIVLNNLVGWAHTTGKIRLMSDGMAWRPLVHIADIAAACVAALEAPRDLIHNQAVNVGVHDENYQVRDLAEIVRETVPGATVEFGGRGGPDPRNYRVDFRKLAKVLPSFTPKWSARTGAAQVYEALRADDTITQEVFCGPRFTRLAHIRRLKDMGALDERLTWLSTPAQPAMASPQLA
jgi:nucleoside-diphosphate-sugar epimerase